MGKRGPRAAGKRAPLFGGLLQKLTTDAKGKPKSLRRISNALNQSLTPLSRDAIHKYRKGETVPDILALAELARVLQVPRLSLIEALLAELTGAATTTDQLLAIVGRSDPTVSTGDHAIPSEGGKSSDLLASSGRITSAPSQSIAGAVDAVVVAADPSRLLVAELRAALTELDHTRARIDAALHDVGAGEQADRTEEAEPTARRGHRRKRER